MTDRELLEMAAKVAGLLVHERNQASRDACGAGDVGLWISQESTCWNPLTDDGDALRLAVKLGMMIDDIDRGYMAGHVMACADQKTARYEPAKPDPYAATRRAIVRAAAEIGKTQ